MSGSDSKLEDGPLSVWNGQDKLASITNDAGEWSHGDQGGLLENMFDGNLDTFWLHCESLSSKSFILKFFNLHVY